VRPETDSDQVWVGVEGQSEGLSARSVQRILERYATQAGLETLTPHTCRHTVAKNLLDSGVGLEKVAALLGHENISTTMIYVTPSAQDLEQAVGTLEKC
jgi:integrase/recombinase XerC